MMPAGMTLGRVTFRISGTSTTALHLTLSSAAHAKLARYKQIAVQLSVIATIGSARQSTYTSTLELTRKLPTLASTPPSGKTKPSSGGKSKATGSKSKRLAHRLAPRGA
jgi:hypothetical protein